MGNREVNCIFNVGANPCKNRTGIPAESRRYSTPEWSGIPVEFQVKSGWIPLDSTGIVAGIPPVFLRNSGLTLAEFRVNSGGIPPRNSAGIIAGISPEFRWIPSRNSTGVTAGIPPDSTMEFRRNNCWHSPEFCRIPSRNSARITAGIPPDSTLEFRWNYCRHSSGISLDSILEFHRSHCHRIFL